MTDLVAETIRWNLFRKIWAQFTGIDPQSTPSNLDTNAFYRAGLNAHMIAQDKKFPLHVIVDSISNSGTAVGDVTNPDDNFTSTTPLVGIANQGTQIFKGGTLTSAGGTDTLYTVTASKTFYCTLISLVDATTAPANWKIGDGSAGSTAFAVRDASLTAVNSLIIPFNPPIKFTTSVSVAGAANNDAVIWGIAGYEI